MNEVFWCRLLALLDGHIPAARGPLFRVAQRYFLVMYTIRPSVASSTNLAL
jgi:hypothetical protein